MFRFGVVLAVCAALLPGQQCRASQDERPNILLIVSDDHRGDVLGCAGHPIVQTPAIDGLAARGVRFSNAFVTTSICAASRATILTGRVERSHRYTFGTPPLSTTMCALSYPARLRSSGYRTGFVGKFGVAIEGGRATRDEMFDWFRPLSRNPYRKTLEDGSVRHVTDITGDLAIEFLRESAGAKPFCLSVSFNAAHAEDGDLDDHFPFPDTEAGLYEGTAMPRPRLDGGEHFESQPAFLKDSLNYRRYGWRWDTPEKYDHNLRNYFRMLTGLDRNVGRMLSELESLGIADRTVVIFIGDNGYYMGERGFAGKWSHYEESLRVPLVMMDPRVSTGGMVAEEMALNTDIAPTVMHLAGLEPDPASQGASLARFARGEPVSEWREAFFCEHLMRHPHIPRWQGSRTARYKHAVYIDQPRGGEFLYDLDADPSELTNLVGSREHRDVLRSMRAETARLAAAHARTGDPLPRVLLLGDSISMGYHRFVEAGLLGEAIVVRPRENCEGTTKGLRRIDEWLVLDGGEFDVIHFNFGLHDLKRVKEDGTNSNDPSDPRQAELEAYRSNLARLVERLEATDAKLIFATTTPFPEGVRPHRTPGDAARYNEAAVALMRERSISVNDLYGFILPQREELQPPVNVHFTPEGSVELGGAVTEAVRLALQSRTR